MTESIFVKSGTTTRSVLEVEPIFNNLLVLKQTCNMNESKHRIVITKDKISSFIDALKKQMEDIE